MEDLDGPHNKKSLSDVLNGMINERNYDEANRRKQVSNILAKIK
jgi:hypothetical protein